MHPIGYFSKKLSLAQINYAIHEKETLAIVEALEHWSIYLYNGVLFMVITDHASFKYL